LAIAVKALWLSLGLAVGFALGTFWWLHRTPNAIALDKALAMITMSEDGGVCTVKPKKSGTSREVPCREVASYLQDELRLPKGPTVALTALGLGPGDVPVDLIKHGYQVAAFIRGPGFTGPIAPPPPSLSPIGPSPPPIEKDCDGVPQPCAENPASGISMLPSSNALDAIQNDGPTGLDRVGFRAVSLYDAKRYQDLDNLIARYTKFQDRIDDGRFKFSGIAVFFGLAFEHRPSERLRSEVEAWRSADPKSPGAAIMEAAYWRHEAWQARGNGYASSVTPEGWRLFHERLRRALALLAASESYAAQNPLWYEESLNVSLELGMPTKQQVVLYERGIKAFPEFYPLNCDMLRALLPKWGGSNRAVHTFIESVVRHSPSALRSQTFTRLWWCADNSTGLDVNVFRDMGASWPRMKAGFESLNESYPGSLWNLVNFASFACRAGDVTTYRRLRTVVGDRVNIYATRAFPSNVSLDVCDRRAGVS
jgi:hypothetical protein